MIIELYARKGCSGLGVLEMTLVKKSLEEMLDEIEIQEWAVYRIFIQEIDTDDTEPLLRIYGVNWFQNFQESVDGEVEQKCGIKQFYEYSPVTLALENAFVHGNQKQSEYPVSVIVNPVNNLDILNWVHI